MLLYIQTVDSESPISKKHLFKTHVYRLRPHTFSTKLLLVASGQRRITLEIGPFESLFLNSLRNWVFKFRTSDVSSCLKTKIPKYVFDIILAEFSNYGKLKSYSCKDFCYEL